MLGNSHLNKQGTDKDTRIRIGLLGRPLERHESSALHGVSHLPQTLGGPRLVMPTAISRVTIAVTVELLISLLVTSPGPSNTYIYIFIYTERDIDIDIRYDIYIHIYI